MHSVILTEAEGSVKKWIDLSASLKMTNPHKLESNKENI